MTGMLMWLLLLLSVLATYALQVQSSQKLPSKTLQPGQFWNSDMICETKSAGQAWLQGYGTGGAAICSTRPTFWNGDPYNVLQAKGLNKKPTTDYGGNVLPPGSSFKADDDVCDQQQDRFPECKRESCPPDTITLPAATKKYNRAFCSDPNNATLPFNERSKTVQQQEETDLLKDYEDFKGLEPNAGGHWYEATLQYPDIENIPNLGRLFTTRVPRNLAYDPFNSTDGVLQSDRLSFQANMKLHQVEVVILLPITDQQFDKARNVARQEYAGTQPNANIHGMWGHNELSPEGANSIHLADFYSSLNLTMFNCPMNDFMPPNPSQLVLCTEAIIGWLIKGKNVVVHCFGGSGRTGLAVASVAKTLGVPDVITRLRSYPGKSVYLDVHEQELMLQQLPRLWSPFLTAVDNTGVVKTAVNLRWHSIVTTTWKSDPNSVVECPTGPLVVLSRCQTMASCRGCMPVGDGEPGAWPLKGQYEIDLPNGYDRKPVIFQKPPVNFLHQGLEYTNNYWYNAEPITQYKCLGTLCPEINL